MKLLRYLLHLIQLGLLYVVYLVDDLYKNHLGFMRNVSFYSHKVEASTFGSMLFLLPALLVVIAVLVTLKRRNLESILLIAIGLFFLVWQLVFTLNTTPIYYLVSVLLFLGFMVQLILVFLKRG
jgi:hypothetical protein